MVTEASMKTLSEIDEFEDIFTSVHQQILFNFGCMTGWVKFFDPCSFL